MRNWINRFLDRFESRVALWLWLGSTGVIGVVTGWLSMASAWINSFGAFAWVFVGLAATLMSLNVVLVGLEIRHKYNRSKAIRVWAERSEVVNPLDDSFSKKRISLQAIADPLERCIAGKTFRDCELMGPCNLVLEKTPVSTAQLLLTATSSYWGTVLEPFTMWLGLWTATLSEAKYPKPRFS